MRVLCISKDPPKENHPDLIDAANKIKIGLNYTVVGEEDGCYELSEFPHPRKILWSKKCFIPLSDIDETELVKERENQLVNQ